MEKYDRITINAAQMNGEPCIRGLRLTVRSVLEGTATYPNREEFKREYPELEDEDIRQALALPQRITNVVKEILGSSPKSPAPVGSQPWPWRRYWKDDASPYLRSRSISRQFPYLHSR